MSIWLRVSGYRQATLEQCIQGVAQGHQAAIDPLFEKLMPLFQEVTRRFDRLSPEVRRELAQEGAVKLCGDIEAVCQRFDPQKGNATAYFQREIRFRVLAAWRKEKRHHQHPLYSVDEEGGPVLAADDRDGGETLDAEARAQAIHDWVATLDPVNRRIADDYLLGELQGSELAEELELSQNAFYKRVERLKGDLGAWLKRQGMVGALLGLLIGAGLLQAFGPSMSEVIACCGEVVPAAEPLVARLANAQHPVPKAFQRWRIVL